MGGNRHAECPPLHPQPHSHLDRTGPVINNSLITSTSSEKPPVPGYVTQPLWIVGLPIVHADNIERARKKRKRLTRGEM